MVNGGSAKAVFILIPLISVVVLAEFIWIKAFGGDIDKYKSKDV